MLVLGVFFFGKQSYKLHVQERLQPRMSYVDYHIDIRILFFYTQLQQAHVYKRTFPM